MTSSHEQIKAYYEHPTKSVATQEKGFLGYLFTKLRRFERHRYQAARDLLPDRMGRVLDIGCGKGDFLFSIQDRAEFAVGLDLSQLNVKQARQQAERKGSKNVGFVCSTPEGFVTSESFDTVTCLAMIEHVFDPFSLFEQFNRLLKPEGLLVLETVNIACITRRLSLLFGVFPRTSWADGWDGGHILYFTYGSMKKRLIEPYGYRVEKYSNSGIFAGMRGIYKSLLAPDILFGARKMAH